VSCPYLGESGGMDYCELGARKISSQRASGYCQTMAFLNCEYYSDADDNSEDIFDE